MDNTVVHLLLILGALVLVSLILAAYNHRKKKNRLSTASEVEAQHRPGYMQLERIDQLSDVMRCSAIAVATTPALVLLTHALYSYFGKVPESPVRSGITAAGVAAFSGWYGIRFLRRRALRKKYQSRYEDEVAVGRELTGLSSMGYHVFHDVPGEKFKIDHVVVGTSGVMVVETYTYGKGDSSGRRAENVVAYDGRMLHFPKLSDHRIIDQTKYQALWLSRWLSSAVGEEISARAMVAMPGWFIKRTSADGIPVVNPKQIKTLFTHIKPRPLTPELVKLICISIERHCLG